MPTEGLAPEEVRFVLQCWLPNSDDLRDYRRKCKRLAKICRSAIALFEELPGGVRYHALMAGTAEGFMAADTLPANLRTVAEHCEREAQGQPGRPADDLLHDLIRAKHAEYIRRQVVVEGRILRGIWKNRDTDEYRGPFFDEVKESLMRCGHPAHSDEALGRAIQRALCDKIDGKMLD